MSLFERLSSFIGIALIGFAAYIVAGDRQRVLEQSQRAAPAVEELSEKLKQAWSGYHNA